METIELNGLIHTDSEYYSLHIGNDILSEQFYEKCYSKVTYYISKRPIDKENVVESFLKSYYQGNTESESNYMYGTSLTCCYGKDDYVIIGSRDLLRELSCFEGKYCYMIIQIQD